MSSLGCSLLSRPERLVTMLCGSGESPLGLARSQALPLRCGFSIEVPGFSRHAAYVRRQLPFCCRDGLPRSMWKQKRMLEHAWSRTSRGPPGHKHNEPSRGCGTSAEQVQYIFSRPQNPAPVWPVMGDFGGCMDLGPTGGDV